MKLLSWNNGWVTTHLTVMDDAKAQAAYDMVKAAMQAYHRFSNDAADTVSFSDDTGEYTLKIGSIAHIGIEDLSEASDELYVENAKRNKRLEEKKAKLLGVYTPAKTVDAADAAI